MGLTMLMLLDGCPRPTHDSWTLQQVEGEARGLMATHPVDPAKGWAEVPKNEWPPIIASLDPEMVWRMHGGVRVIVKPFFDGGWGYFIPPRTDHATPNPCYRRLSESVYWHDPC